MRVEAAAVGDALACPLQEQAEGVLDVAIALVKALRRLRRLRLRCEACSQVESCPFWGQFNRQVDIAIQEINQEWGMG